MVDPRYNYLAVRQRKRVRQQRATVSAFLTVGFSPAHKPTVN